MYTFMDDYKTKIKRSPFISPPPSQDSPHHILNILNDECIQRILRYLVEVRDFLSAAEVCKRFQENAKEGFPSIYEDFRICPRYKDSVLSFHQVKRFLGIFGHLIRSIDWRLNEDASEIFKVLVEYCGKSLIKLKVWGQELNFNFTPCFTALEEMELVFADLNNFKPPPELKKLHIATSESNDKFNWLSQNMPKLTKANFCNLDSLDDAILHNFLALNPQLETLSLVSQKNVTSSILQSIPVRTPNLIELSFDFCNAPLQEKLEEDVMHLIGLRKLRKLLFRRTKILSGKLFDSFADNDIQIEHLQIGAVNRCIAESLAKMKRLKILVLRGTSEEVIIDIVKKIPTLEELGLESRNKMSQEGIKEILENGKNLKYLSLRAQSMIIDRDGYTSILNLASNRVEVQIDLTQSTTVQVHVEKDVLQANRKWLNIVCRI